MTIFDTFSHIQPETYNTHFWSIIIKNDYLLNNKLISHIIFKISQFHKYKLSITSLKIVNIYDLSIFILYFIRTDKSKFHGIWINRLISS